MIDLFLEFGKLKNIPRTGWILRGLGHNQIESVAEHVARTVFIAMHISNILLKKGLKLNKSEILEMALIHDLSESMLLDIDKDVAKLLGKNFKKNIEKTIESTILNTLESFFQRYYKNLLLEFHKCTTLESQIVKISDNIETLIQAYEYEKTGIPKKCLQEFWDTNKKVITTIEEPELKKITNKLFINLENMRQSL